MTEGGVRVSLLDASALVQLVVDEIGCDIVREYEARESATYSTPFCLYEALSVLKGKWRKSKAESPFNRKQYLDASLQLCAWYRARAQSIADIDLVSPETFADARRIAEKTNLDLSDAFQILSVKAGYFSGLAGASRTLLVTGDKDLAKAARGEDIVAWYYLKEPEPRTGNK